MTAAEIDRAISEAFKAVFARMQQSQGG